MTTETVDRVYCSYSGADISMDVDVPIHIWETFVPKEKLQDELDFLEDKGFDLEWVDVSNSFVATVPYWNGMDVNDITHVHLETTVDHDSHGWIEDFLHARGWKHDEERGSTLYHDFGGDE